MIILWIRRNRDARRSGDFGDGESFREHDDLMKRFRFAHPDVNLAGSRDVITPEGNLLAPVHRVKLAENIQN